MHVHRLLLIDCAGPINRQLAVRPIRQQIECLVSRCVDTVTCCMATNASQNMHAISSQGDAFVSVLFESHSYCTVDLSPIICQMEEGRSLPNRHPYVSGHRRYLRFSSSLHQLHSIAMGLELVELLAPPHGECMVRQDNTPILTA